jgi:hypothetical protein
LGAHTSSGSQRLLFSRAKKNDRSTGDWRCSKAMQSSSETAGGKGDQNDQVDLQREAAYWRDHAWPAFWFASYHVWVEPPNREKRIAIPCRARMTCQRLFGNVRHWIFLSLDLKNLFLFRHLKRQLLWSAVFTPKQFEGVNLVRARFYRVPSHSGRRAPISSLLGFSPFPSRLTRGLLTAC